MSKQADFLFGVAVGSVIGATVALLYAPRSGSETRDDLKRKGEELKDSATEKVKDAVSRAESLTEQIKEKTTDIAGTMRDTATHLASQVESKLSSRKDRDTVESTVGG